jgi:quinol monooxygenase YgiN
MTTFIATMNLAAGCEAEVEPVCAELSEVSQRKESGLVSYDIIRKRDDPSTYLFYARFKDEDAFNFHQEADFHLRLVPPILECVEGEMDLQFFDWVA